jgi:flagellar motor component MotA
LPILGATCGIFLAAMSGTIYALAEINPSQMLSAAIAPAALALLAGFSQEWFYGAR